MSQSQINDLTDRVRSLTAALSRSETREAQLLGRANRAEANYESLKQVNDARRKALASTVLSYSEQSVVLTTTRSLLKGTKRAWAEAEAERIALADAWRAQMEGQGVAPTSAALLVQGVIDNARDSFRANKEKSDGPQEA